MILLLTRHVIRLRPKNQCGRPLCARSGRCYKWQGFKRQNVYFILQHLDYLKFFCDQLHIVRKMSRTGEKSLMLFLPVLKA